MRDVELPGPAQREAAWKVVRRFLAVTPVVGTSQLGPSVSVKVETVQPTGSFKVRGGLAAVSATLEQDPGRAVVASSAGNHGLGLAYAASELGATVPIEVEPTVADGVAGNLEPGAVTVGVALSHGVDVLTVSEADIRSAMAFSASKMGLVLEGAGAVGIAALRAGVVTSAAEKETVVLLTGRNVAPKLLSEVL